MSDADKTDDWLKRLVEEGRKSMLDMARQGQTQLRQRALKREQEDMWVRLGKIAYRLAEAGELDHPAILKAVSRLRTLDETLDGADAAVSSDADPASNPS